MMDKNHNCDCEKCKKHCHGGEHKHMDISTMSKENLLWKKEKLEKRLEEISEAISKAE